MKTLLPKDQICCGLLKQCSAMNVFFQQRKLQLPSALVNFSPAGLLAGWNVFATNFLMLTTASLICCGGIACD